MFEEIETQNKINHYILKNHKDIKPITFEDIEKQWYIPDVIYVKGQSQPELQPESINTTLDKLVLPPPPPPQQSSFDLRLKRSITVEYEYCRTKPSLENPSGIDFQRLKYASIGHYNSISVKTREMIYTLLNIKILESYKDCPQYWEDVDIKNYLYRTKQPYNFIN
jgi:hypothetical protein